MPSTSFSTERFLKAFIAELVMAGIKAIPPRDLDVRKALNRPYVSTAPQNIRICGGGSTKVGGCREPSITSAVKERAGMRSPSMAF